MIALTILLIITLYLLGLALEAPGLADSITHHASRIGASTHRRIEPNK